MSINTQLIKALNQITDRATQEEYTDSMIGQHFDLPMDDVVVKTEHFAPRESVEFPFRRHPLPCLEFTYTLSGDIVLSIRNESGAWTNNYISGGIRALGYKSEFSGIATVNSSTHIKSLQLYITPQKLAQLLGPGNGRMVRAIIEKADPGTPNDKLNMTPMSPLTTTIIHQIFSRNGTSPVDYLFLKGKIYELLACEVELLCSPPPKQTILQPDDLVKLQQARTIMMERMSSPPSITELARKVGLNEKKIRNGFKELYGTTVYGFLRGYRMKQAKMLFDRDRNSVTDVAFAVGYSNASHFGVIFRQHHGVLPGEYLRSLKKEWMKHHLHQ